MSAIFDPLNYTIEAEKVGIKREHAEFNARVLANLINEDLVTNRSLAYQLKDLEVRLFLRLGSLIVACTGILGFILKH